MNTVLTKNAQSSVVNRKPTAAEKRECYSLFTELRKKMHGETAAKLGLTADEFYVLQDVSWRPFRTVREMQRENPLWMQDRAVVVKILINKGFLHGRSGYLTLTRIGQIYISAAYEVPSKATAAVAGMN